jgi:hypothetical protein
VDAAERKRERRSRSALRARAFMKKVSVKQP